MAALKIASTVTAERAWRGAHCPVTGANQGTGLQIARNLAKHRLTVLVGSRHLERGAAAARTTKGDARALQFDVTDQTSVAAAVERVDEEYGRLALLVNNAAISNARREPGMSLQDYPKLARAGNVPLNEVRGIWDTNVFVVLTLTQAMLPLLHQASAGRIVNVSSGVGSLTRATDPTYSYRLLFGPGYLASGTILNAIAVAFAIELEPTGVKVNAVSPSFTKTNLNGYEGTETVEQGAAEAVRLALLGPDGPAGTVTQTTGPIPWLRRGGRSRVPVGLSVLAGAICLRSPAHPRPRCSTPSPGGSRGFIRRRL